MDASRPFSINICERIGESGEVVFGIRAIQNCKMGSPTLGLENDLVMPKGHDSYVEEIYALD